MGAARAAPAGGMKCRPQLCSWRSHPDRRQWTKHRSGHGPHGLQAAVSPGTEALGSGGTACPGPRADGLGHPSPGRVKGAQARPCLASLSELQDGRPFRSDAQGSIRGHRLSPGLQPAGSWVQAFHCRIVEAREGSGVGEGVDRVCRRGPRPRARTGRRERGVGPEGRQPGNTADRPRTRAGAGWPPSGPQDLLLLSVEGFSLRGGGHRGGSVRGWGVVGVTWRQRRASQ